MAYLFELDFRIDVHVTDFAVERLVLQARAFQDVGLHLEFGPRPGVGLNGTSPVPRLQHGFVLRA